MPLKSAEIASTLTTHEVPICASVVRDDGLVTDNERQLTESQAYEAAFRFVMQYFAREPQSESLLRMAVAMEPEDDYARTHDPASWEDWRRCVSQTLDGEPLPSLAR